MKPLRGDSGAPKTSLEAAAASDLPPATREALEAALGKLALDSSEQQRIMSHAARRELARKRLGLCCGGRMSDFGDIGGMGLEVFFRTLRSSIVLMLVASVLNLPLLINNWVQVRGLHSSTHLAQVVSQARACVCVCVGVVVVVVVGGSRPVIRRASTDLRGYK